MKNKVFKIAVPTILLVCIISTLMVKFNTKSLEDLLGTKEINVTSVFMRSGNSGKIVSTTDKDKIQELFGLLDNRNYIKSLNQSPRTGYNYYYDFYEEGKQILRITGSGDNVNINGKYYNVNKAISVDSLTIWFDSLSSKE